MTTTTKRLLVAFTDELYEVIESARGDTRRSAFIEDLLWRSGKVKNEAARKKLKRQDRPKPGRVPRGD